MRTTSAYVLSLLFILFAGCKKDEQPSAPQEQFADRLTLGNGMSGFVITGEATSFTRMGNSAAIYWKLESSVDMAGSAVKIRFDRVTGGTAAPYDSLTYTNPQQYGHIMLSVYTFDGTAGSYRATGILQGTGRVVASKDFTVQ